MESYTAMGFPSPRVARTIRRLGTEDKTKVCECTVVSVKELSWAEHLTSLPKRGVGALLSVSAFNHERAPMSCL